MDKLLLDACLQSTIEYLDDLMLKRKVAENLDLPSWEGRDAAEQAQWLREHVPADELRAMFRRSMRVLDHFEPSDHEWELLTDLMAPLWDALEEIGLSEPPLVDQAFKRKTE